MIWILATRGASWFSGMDETVIEGVHSLVYKVGVEAIPADGEDPEYELGEYIRGLHRASGFLFTWHGSAAEELLSIDEAVALEVRYRASGEHRKRTFSEVIFAGDATVAFPSLNTGISELIGVPFRVQIPEDETIGDRIVDEVDE